MIRGAAAIPRRARPASKPPRPTTRGPCSAATARRRALPAGRCPRSSNCSGPSRSEGRLRGHGGDRRRHGVRRQHERQALRRRPGDRQEAVGVPHRVGLRRLGRRARRPGLRRRQRRRVPLRRRRDAASRKWKFTTDAEIDSSANFSRPRPVRLAGRLPLLPRRPRRASGLEVREPQPDPLLPDDGRRPRVRRRLRRAPARDRPGQGQGDRRASTSKRPPAPRPPSSGDCSSWAPRGRPFFAIDWKQAKVLWRYANAERGDPFRSSAAVTADLVVVGSRDKLVHALDPKTGKRALDVRHPRPRRQFAGDRRRAGLRRLGRRPALRPRLQDAARSSGSSRPAGRVLASPAVAAGRLVIGTDAGDLYCFGKKAQRR